MTADPGLLEARNNLALALARVDRPGEARRELEKALAIDPDFALARANLARLGAGVASE